MNIRPIESKDYKFVEQLIRDTILTVNTKDYSKPIIDIMLRMDPYMPQNARHERDYFVYSDGKIIKGVIGVIDNEIKTFFVSPSYHGKGIGTSLLSYIEVIIINKGYKFSKVFSSISAKSFYEKQGYTMINEDLTENVKNPTLRYYMEKNI